MLQCKRYVFACKRAPSSDWVCLGVQQGLYILRDTWQLNRKQVKQALHTLGSLRRAQILVSVYKRGHPATYHSSSSLGHFCHVSTLVVPFWPHLRPRRL
jgi:hypothetical protein